MTRLPPCDHDECPPTRCTHEKPNDTSAEAPSEVASPSGAFSVPGGSLPVSSVQSLVSRFLAHAQEKEDRADNYDQEGFYGRAEEARAHARIWEWAADDLRAEMEAANVRQPEENDAHQPTRRTNAS